MSKFFVSGLTTVIVGLMTGSASAQNLPDPSETARIRAGVLSLTPRFGLRNFGVDTNVYNLADEPQRDLTATVSGGADVWVRLGRGVVASRTTVDLNHFVKAADQRSLNITQDGRLDVDLRLFVPRVGGSFVNTRQRPNDEFDIRVQQRNTLAYGGVLVPIGSKARLEAEFRQEEYDYATGEHGDSDIASALNRKSRRAAIQGGFDITPLTRFVTHVDVRQDRFVYSADRNSDSLRVMPGLELQPSALVSGKAFIGYRRFETPSVTVPNITALVALVELTFVAADAFRIKGQVSRDLDYSIDLDESVYVSTSAGLEVVQAVGLDWDVVVRARHAALGYQQIGPVPGRTDRVWVAGGGLGRHIANDVRVGFDVDYVNRFSVRGDLAYNGLRFGASVTYGY